MPAPDRSKDKHRLTATSFRLSIEARTLLAEIAAYEGISQAAVLEQVIRKEARRLGI